MQGIFKILLTYHESKRDFPFKKSLSSPYGNRTRVSAVRGRRLNRLTNEPFIILSYRSSDCKHFFIFFYLIFYIFYLILQITLILRFTARDIQERPHKKRTSFSGNPFAVRTGIEPVFPPWEGGVLTAWPTNRLLYYQTVCSMSRGFSKIFSFFWKKRQFTKCHYSE